MAGTVFLVSEFLMVRKISYMILLLEFTLKIVKINEWITLVERTKFPTKLTPVTSSLVLLEGSRLFVCFVFICLLGFCCFVCQKFYFDGLLLAVTTNCIQHL